MEVEGAENAVLGSSAVNSTESQQNEVFSPEDIAWVDSCLNKDDSDISESKWIPLRDALLDIITSQSQSLHTFDGEDAEILPDTEERKTSSEHNQESSTSDAERLPKPRSTHNVDPLSLAAETDEIVDNEKTGTFHGNPFLPTYNEDKKQNETFDIGINLDSATYEMEHASEDIFKVWDLDIPAEEGELVKELKKALSENSFPTTDGSGKGSDSWEGTLDDVLTGIADLSLDKIV